MTRFLLIRWPYSILPLSFFETSGYEKGSKIENAVNIFHKYILKTDSYFPKLSVDFIKVKKLYKPFVILHPILI